LDRWYRARLKEVLPSLVADWQVRLEVEVADWRIRRMKTKWASCNPKTRRLWFNTELAKKPRAAIEYLVVHELMHLMHRRHDERFIAAMTEDMPKWLSIRRELGQLPLTRDWWPED
jgi:predicted metal-dependent hydrolase